MASPFAIFQSWDRIPTSELGPARGPIPGLNTQPAGPRYVDKGDRVQPARRASGGAPLFSRGNLLGDLVAGFLELLLNAPRTAAAQAAGPAGQIVAARIPSIRVGVPQEQADQSKTPIGPKTSAALETLSAGYAGDIEAMTQAAAERGKITLPADATGGDLDGGESINGRAV